MVLTGSGTEGKRSRPHKKHHRRDPAEMKPGLAARQAAARLLSAVTESRASLDGLLDATGGNPAFTGLGDQDRLLVRAILLSALRHLRVIDAFIDQLVDTPLPDGAKALRQVLRVGAAQILYLDIPDRAAVDLAVSQADADPRNRRFAGLVNALLRRMAREKETVLPEISAVTPDFPEWFESRLRRSYADEADAILSNLSQPPAIDLTVKTDAEGWAARLGGVVLPTGSVRIGRPEGPVSGFEGYDDGGWWVQDAAASLPAQMFSKLEGLEIADLCAAPGGKTAQLALAGARVTACDQSANRLERLRGNMARLGFDVATRLTRAQDLVAPDGFDGVLLDAPCSSTGTVRRHPDIFYTKGPDDIERLAQVQRDLLDHAAGLVRPQGELVFANCSIDPAEGEEMVAGFLADHPAWKIKPIDPARWPGLELAITKKGEIRTHPAMLANEDPRLAGLDGFYGVVLTRR
ncbi:RsmB/NOP family class I SAM-dependent RNA methyltransferase [Hoeflea sp. YIM 152468]|uniref:RsmB/NOP family class I SAM-dependent RNA methyltransferase n=1 Tax=Hoeflea sp. YIM 152468 TaxID=3031759 RepID=UPI0023DCE308|nr:RsmB/NOP family class I SAM-dependent RNA methyltransferase [Hoeflea sp. YIM 152468]MDF1608265.1 RsmB/NOP family class I SAM-dependent RNA methyltransferase [Hoeflea sp. YIM 152468]